MIANDEFEAFSIDDRVVITGGNSEGETGVIIDIRDVIPWGVVFDVKLDNGVRIATLPHLVDHAPEKPVRSLDILKHGMSSEDLAHSVHAVIHYCMDRVNGVGAEQYAEETHQKFEAMSMEDLMEYQIEEIADDINYAVMRFIRLRRIQAAMANHL